MASIAYSEQVGINLQLAGNTGEIINWYNLINVMKTCFIFKNTLQYSVPITAMNPDKSVYHAITSVLAVRRKFRLP